MIFDWVLGWFSNDLAIDLGTANTLVYVKGKGIVLREPSVVAVARDARGGDRVRAVGKEAKEMLGRTPGNIVAIRPMKDGVIADFDITEAMLRYFIRKVHDRSTLVKPRIVIAVPSGITEVEKRAVRESARCAGAREVYLIEEPMAAAIGAGLPVTEPSGNMIVDIGGGTTEVAVISLAGIVYSKSRPRRRRRDGRGHRQLHQAQVQPADRRAHRRADQDRRSAPPIPTRAGSRRWRSRAATWSPACRRPSTSPAEEIREALAEPVNADRRGRASIALEQTPPELAADIVDKGIVLAGGGSLLRNLDVLLRETGAPRDGGRRPPDRRGHGNRADARRSFLAQGNRDSVVASPRSPSDVMGEFRSRIAFSLLIAALVAVATISMVVDRRARLRSESLLPG